MFTNRYDADQITKEILDILVKSEAIDPSDPDYAGLEEEIELHIWMRGGLTWNGLKWTEETAEIVEPKKAKS